MNNQQSRLREAPSERFAGKEHFFDLSARSADLARECHDGQHGHRQITLHHQGPVAVVLFAFEADGELKDHSANGLVTIQALGGALEVRTAQKNYSLTAGTMVMLDPKVVHSVRASEASQMLLTVHLIGENL